MRRTTATLDTPCHYEVVGEHIVDPARLLVVGDMVTSTRSISQTATLPPLNSLMSG